LIFYFLVLSPVIIHIFHFRIMDKLQFISNRDSVADMESFKLKLYWDFSILVLVLLGMNTAYCHALLSGQVYRLRNPSARYVASLSSYDSADPTKDWDFPQLSSNTNSTHVSKSSQSTPSTEIPTAKDLPTLPSQLSASKVCTQKLKSINLLLLFPPLP